MFHPFYAFDITSYEEEDKQIINIEREQYRVLTRIKNKMKKYCNQITGKRAMIIECNNYNQTHIQPKIKEKKYKMQQEIYKDIYTIVKSLENINPKPREVRHTIYIQVI